MAALRAQDHLYSAIFFPDVSPAIGLIAAMATYGGGYAARLAGAICSGRMGDRIGRKRVLFITIAMMGASTTLIGVLPTYATIGILAPVLLVVLRLIQGFGAGAEIAGATVMLAEYAAVRRRGLIASLVSLGTNSGTLAASRLWAVLLAVLTEEQLLGRGWRLPFLLSFVLMIFAVDGRDAPRLLRPPRIRVAVPPDPVGRPRRRTAEQNDRCASPRCPQRPRGRGRDDRRTRGPFPRAPRR
ncbi:MFS transporter [Catenuloplanes indicus]|uniref:MFS family permease n=1 Tax=Catenuloplanes indicus TaxID=137267 RepID=A0AAE3VUV7_9ACTN|nr:MFS transporter [Catenuloplanes indicus]MDQ0364047.1 MFS family permease [Catenuloplanes indicus]